MHSLRMHITQIYKYIDAQINKYTKYKYMKNQKYTALIAISASLARYQNALSTLIFLRSPQTSEDINRLARLHFSYFSSISYFSTSSISCWRLYLCCIPWHICSASCVRMKFLVLYICVCIVDTYTHTHMNECMWIPYVFCTLQTCITTVAMNVIRCWSERYHT